MNQPEPTPNPADVMADAPEQVIATDTEKPETQTDEASSENLSSTPEGFRQRVDKFVREHFKGEHVDEKPLESNTKQVTKTIGKSVIGAAASLVGIKSLVDLPRWFAQKYYTKKEHARIQSALNIEPATEVDEATVYLTPLQVKKNRLEQALNESKYIAPAKKAELLQKLHDTIETYEATLIEDEKLRNEKIAKLLDETIQTRVKGTTALKETLNTALIATGLSTLRGLGYGAVALYERGVKVKAEKETGERTESFVKELVINGFKETWEKLRLKKGETKIQKAVNFGQALGTVMRFGGFAGLAIGEMSGEGGPSAAINKALEAFEQKGALQASADNYVEQFEKVKNIATLGLLKEDEVPEQAAPETVEQEGSTPAASTEAAAAETPQAAAENVAPVIEPEAVTSTDAVATDAEPVAVTEPEPVTPTAEAVEPEPVTQIVFEEPDVIKATDEVPADTQTEVASANTNETISQEELATGAVHKGDGVIRIIQRQLKANPEKYGYTGDPEDKKALAKWVRKTAFAATKKAGFVNQDGWLGIRGKAIDKLSIGLTNKNGELKFDFYDAKTGQPMSMEDMRTGGLVHDYQKPSEILEDTSPEPGVKAPEVGIEKAVEPAEPTEVEPIAEMPPPLRAELGIDEQAPEAPEASAEEEEVKPIDEFRSSSGKVSFDHQGDKIRIRLDYTRTDEDIERAATQFDTSKDGVYKAYLKKLPLSRDGAITGAYRINGKADALLGKMEELVRTKGILKEMADKGLQDTDEYRQLNKQAGVFKGVISRTFEQLGLEEKLGHLERTFSGVKAEVVPDAAVAEVAPEAAVAEAAATKPEPAVPEPTLEKGPGGIEFTSDYTAEERAKIADYVSRERLVKPAVQKLLAEYQTKYGDRPQFGAFKAAIEKTMQGQDAHINQVIQQAAGKIPGHPEVNMSGNMNPEQAARAFANAKIALAERKVDLLTMSERAEDAFRELK